MNEDELRRILIREAESTEVSPDALEIIRDRIERRARWWRPRGFTLVGATAFAAAAMVLIVVLAGHWVPRPAPPVPPGGSAGSSPSATPPGSANVPVYYVGATSLGPRLYREYHVRPVSGPGPAAKARAAVAEMLDPHSHADPDYGSPWPAGVEVREASVTGGAVTVDLGGVPATSGLDATTVRIALEQLIWTATAASGTTAMHLLLDGRPATTFWGLPGTGGVLERGPRADVYAPVWLIDPQQGAVVGHPFAVYLAGIVAEGAVRLRVRDATGAVVSDQSVPLNAGAPALGEARLQLSLPPGIYTIEGYVASARDGSAQFPDNHVVTVR